MPLDDGGFFRREYAGEGVPPFASFPEKVSHAGRLLAHARQPAAALAVSRGAGLLAQVHSRLRVRRGAVAFFVDARQPHASGGVRGIATALQGGDGARRVPQVPLKPAVAALGTGGRPSPPPRPAQVVPPPPPALGP